MTVVAFPSTIHTLSIEVIPVQDQCRLDGLAMGMGIFLDGLGFEILDFLTRFRFRLVRYQWTWKGGQTFSCSQQAAACSVAVGRIEETILRRLTWKTMQADGREFFGSTTGPLKNLVL